MIHKEIQTNFSRTIHFAVWGKEETKELEGISKEELTPAIRNFVAKKLNTPSKKVFLLEQVHGDTFYDTKNLSTLSAEGDALQKYLLGIDIVLRQRLIDNNLPIQFIDSDICTMDDRNYHSHRCGDKGRNLNLIWMS
jgi:copper oxidase (laccase) domain-containing protein